VQNINKVEDKIRDSLMRLESDLYWSNPWF
jgi:hypothetical protein